MTRFIVVTFLFLAFAFYELSGGSEFEPRGTREMAAAARAAKAEDRRAARLAPTVETPRIAQATRTPAKPAAPRDVSAVPQIAAAFEPAADRINLVPVALTASDVDAAELSLASLGGSEVTSLSPLDTFSPNRPAAPARASAPQAESEPQSDIRTIVGNRVNMRNGPGTDYQVLARMLSGDEVVVLADPGNGWLKLRAMDGGPIGWMADFLVSEPRG